MCYNDYEVVWLKSVSLFTCVKTQAYDNPSCQPFRISETKGTNSTLGLTK